LNARRGAIRLLTWNVHGGVGADGIFDLDRIVALVRRHEPDIVALQEVDSRRHHKGEASFAFLRRSLGRHAVEAKAISAPDGDYGHVVISRWPMTKTVLHDISVTGREPRRAIETTIETEHGPMHLVTVHLGLSFHERRGQARALVAMVESAPETTVMAGDFNDWLWRGSVTLSLSRRLPCRSEHRTFPARCPLAKLDRIYCRPATALVKSWTDKEARFASDHLPVAALIAVSHD
jgi:endonuclease/exonuclease/phosphatase family metal-dependent hydrolase